MKKILLRILLTISIIVVIIFQSFLIYVVNANLERPLKIVKGVIMLELSNEEVFVADTFNDKPSILIAKSEDTDKVIKFVEDLGYDYKEYNERDGWYIFRGYTLDKIPLNEKYIAYQSTLAVPNEYITEVEWSFYK